MTVQRVRHVGGGQGFAVVEVDPFAQADGPGDGVVGGHLLGQHHLRRQLGIERGQAVIEHVGAQVVGRQRAFGRVQGVGVGTGLGGNGQRAAPARLLLARLKQSAGRQ